MNIIKKDLRQIRYDVIVLFTRIIALPQQEMIPLLGFFGIWTIAFCFDSEIRLLTSQIHMEFFDRLFSLFHWYGKAFLTIVTLCIFYFGGVVLAQPRLKETGLKIFESFAFSGIIVTILKSIFGRWRPYTEHGSFSFQFFTLGSNDHLSLPSGDVAIAFAFSTIIAGTIDNKIWRSIWYMFAIITSMGRMYHDQHWMSDVILSAGIAIYIGYFIRTRTSIVFP